ncbi:putative transmembrane protein [Salipiger mucosus DSM 16094]|uniref:Putative transmembrane protein n=1 Tax=Salipiger mucosus DSM 16094 TaxID=1123237 RepID=S9QJG1_9RHOB|nr:putative transmembrane protein [Salipiger mucosus DSM 16094]
MTSATGGPPPRPGLAERLARRDILIVAAAVAAIFAIAAIYTLSGVGMNMSALEMTRMARPVGQPMQMPMAPQWSAGYALLVFLMWWIMMIAMMTPSAAPMLLLFVALKKAGTDRERAHALGLLFLAGYLLAWAGFSALATGLQWGLEAAGLVEGAMMAVSSRLLAGMVLLAAGLYQFSTLKHACLDHCRSPAHFVAAHHRPGPGGALVMGSTTGSTASVAAGRSWPCSSWAGS